MNVVLRHMVSDAEKRMGIGANPVKVLTSRRNEATFTGEKPNEMVECRCKKCSRVLLAAKRGSYVRLRCKKCGTWNTFSIA